MIQCVCLRQKGSLSLGAGGELRPEEKMVTTIQLRSGKLSRGIPAVVP